MVANKMCGRREGRKKEIKWRNEGRKYGRKIGGN